jgi:hypothetical protein
MCLQNSRFFLIVNIDMTLLVEATTLRSDSNSFCLNKILAPCPFKIQTWVLHDYSSFRQLPFQGYLVRKFRQV